MWPAAKAPQRDTCSNTGYRNIRVFDSALGATDGTARLYLTMNRAKHSLIRRRDERDSADSIMVEVRTLDGVLAEAQQHAVDMIKIDVEGAELAVFRGATATLRQNRNIVLLIDLHPRLGVKLRAVSRFLKARAFAFPGSRRLCERESISSRIAEYHG
jgi:FkbM family methyltransferase